MKIEYRNINTNNLKNVNFSIEQNSIQLIQGPSGSGKSSLAIDTVYKISEDELYQLLNLKEGISKYSIENYSNILPSICLKQENYNTNPRSTIATYFNLDSFFIEIFSRKSMLSARTFSFNISDFACDSCNGLGVELKPDIHKIIDYSCSIKNIPFIPWKNSKKSYYKKLLTLYAESHYIDLEKIYSELSTKHQLLLLNGVSEEKYKIKFKSQGCNHVKTAKYIGPYTYLTNELKKEQFRKHNLNYCSYQKCEKCKGGRFNTLALKHRIHDKTIADLYLMEVKELFNWLINYKTTYGTKKVNLKSYNNTYEFLKNMILLKLSYLNLNRSIPSLSGGELQRLRLSKAITSHFFNFLYVLDEPTSGLHPSEWVLIAKIIKRLKKNNNTILLIENNPCIEKIANSIVYLGPEGGKGGGKILANTKSDFTFNFNNTEYFSSKSNVLIKNSSSNNINNLTIRIPLNTFVGICGTSGSGKTSLIKNILPKYLKQSIYLDQNPIKSNSYSIIATSLGIMTYIQEIFAKKCKVSKEYFTFSSKGKGQCQLCEGKGFVQELSINTNYKVVCSECNGRRFSLKSLKLRYKNYNIYELLMLDIDSIKEIIEIDNNRLNSILSLSSNIGIGYLNLFQNIDSLSGGEAQRIKFVNTIFKNKRKQIFLLDEPFSGVDDMNINKMITCLYDFIKKGYTVFIAAHNPSVLKYVSYIIELGPGGGDNGGKIIFEGKLADIKRKKNNSIIKKYL